MHKPFQPMKESLPNTELLHPIVKETIWVVSDNIGSEIPYQDTLEYDSSKMTREQAIRQYRYQSECHRGEYWLGDYPIDDPVAFAHQEINNLRKRIAKWEAFLHTFEPE